METPQTPKTNKEILEAINKKIMSQLSDGTVDNHIEEGILEDYMRKSSRQRQKYVVNTWGTILPNGITEADLEQVGMQSQGCFPLGSNCAKKLFGKDIEKYVFRYSDKKV